MSEEEAVCLPLKSYDDVINWARSCPTWPKYAIKMQSSTDDCVSGAMVTCQQQFEEAESLKRLNRNNVPKTLVCHDMRGGYTEDRFIDGCDSNDAYRLFLWAGIDIFVYFSHNFVTIPPLGWINAAHLHGVKVLGTLITEWKDGEKLCSQMLGDDSEIERFVDCLVSICKYFQFDGYLLNIENIIPPNAVGRLELFVRLLQTKLAAQISHAQVIWYDSVTVNGDLKWQNELNDLNRNFFDLCDGIFLNYNWTEATLQSSVKAANSRNFDVYVGVDVFGRGCYGGGGFCSNLAVELARQYNLSIAIFAPGWVHETLGTRHFLEYEYMFWEKLWPHLFLHGPTELPFTTSFCQGCGVNYYCNGLNTKHPPWYNLRIQQYQPSIHSCPSNFQLNTNVCSDKQDTSDGGGVEGSVNTVESQASATSCDGQKAGTTDVGQEGGGTEEVGASGSSDGLEDAGMKPETTPLPPPPDPICGGFVQHYQLDGFNGGGCLKIHCPITTDIPQSSTSCVQRILMCGFPCDGDMVISCATKNIGDLEATLRLVLFVENNTTKCVSKKRLVCSKRNLRNVLGPEEVCALTSAETEAMSHEVKDLPKQAGGGWKLSHFVLQVHGTILEVGAELSGPGEDILLGLIRIGPVTSNNTEH